jgi:hypothetical protein
VSVKMSTRALAPLLAIAVLLAAVGPACAQVISKSKEGVAAQGELSFVIGSGVEYQSDSEQTEIGLPVSVEIAFTEDFKLTLEWSYLWIHSKTRTVRSANGIGDLETFMEYEFLPERRYRPALTLEAGVKWPTASAPDLGTGKYDYTIGLIASKEITVDWKLDFGVVYTFLGSPAGVHLNDNLEISLAAQWKISSLFDFEAEALYTHGGGGSFRGQLGTVGGYGGALVGGGGSEFEFSIGLAEHITDHMKIEEGAVIQPDGTWQAVIFWEYDFGEGK